LHNNKMHNSHLGKQSQNCMVNSVFTISMIPNNEELIRKPHGLGYPMTLDRNQRTWCTACFRFVKSLLSLQQTFYITKPPINCQTCGKA